jgi:uncharacterized protein (TIGR03083 family)
MGLLDLWRSGQQAMSALGRIIDDAAAETPVPACPGWTVRQVYAHQAGAAADVLAGNMEGAPGDAWTAKQVGDRADRSLTELLDEWDAAAPRLVEALTPVEDQLDPAIVMDLWHHHQDVRNALGLPVDTSDELSQWVLDRSHRYLRRLTRDTEIEVVIGDPPEEPAPGVLTVPAYEAARAMLGRRSLDQIRAWSWGFDPPEDLVAAVPVFRPRPDALVEAPA